MIPDTGRQKDYLRLREEHPEFHYRGYEFSFDEMGLQIRYDFEIPGLSEFHPTWVFPSVSKVRAESLPVLEELVFSLGLVELISYWKATCSPVVHLPRFLTPEAVQWWEKLFFRGLGEFRYLNGIDAGMDEFVQFDVQDGAMREGSYLQLDADALLVPVGGGKDSVVSLEILSRAGYDCTPFMVNPTGASIRTSELAEMAGPAFSVQRRLDKELLGLNDRGFLNGHTPFSAILAFSSAIAAVLKGVSRIALSNEASANEDTIPGTGINHQYSKSYEFEEDLRFYFGRWISPSLNYFSFLRPLSELTIAALFSGFDVHLSEFRSCNAGSREGIWCGSCPKCLFAFIILLPFVSHGRLAEVFGKDLLADVNLLPWLRELSGLTDAKPFECVGTIDEVRLAMVHSFPGEQLPPLLNEIREDLDHWRNTIPVSFCDFLPAIHSPHNVPDNLMKHITDAVDALSCD